MLRFHDTADLICSQIKSCIFKSCVHCPFSKRIGRITVLIVLGDQPHKVKAAGKYYDSLNDRELQLLSVDERLLRTMYEEYALAGKVYEYLIADINPEISDDEARTFVFPYSFNLTLQPVIIKTTASRTADILAAYLGKKLMSASIKNFLNFI